MVDRQHIEPGDRQIIAELLRRIEVARRFPHNTDPCVRHVELMGEALCRGLPYPMLDEERGHCAISLLSVVAALYEARNAGVPDALPPSKPTSEQMMAGYAVACRFGVLEARAFNLAKQMWQAMGAAGASVVGQVPLQGVQLSPQGDGLLATSKVENELTNEAAEVSVGGDVVAVAQHDVQDGKAEFDIHPPIVLPAGTAGGVDAKLDTDGVTRTEDETGGQQK